MSWRAVRPFRARLERPEVTKTGEFSNVISGENCSATHSRFIRDLFRRYLEIGSVVRLKAFLTRRTPGCRYGPTGRARP